MFEKFKDMCFKFHFKNLITKVELSLFKPQFKQPKETLLFCLSFSLFASGPLPILACSRSSQQSRQPSPCRLFPFSAHRAAHISQALHWHLPIHELGQKPIAHKATALPWPCAVRMSPPSYSGAEEPASHVLSCPVGDQNPAMGLQCPPPRPWPCVVAAAIRWENRRSSLLGAQVLFVSTVQSIAAFTLNPR